MRHHPQDISFAICNSGDIVKRAVRVGFVSGRAAGVTVTEEDAALGFELRHRRLVAEVISFPVRDWNAQNLALPVPIGEWSIQSLDADVNVLADVFQASIAQQRAWQKPGFA